MNPVPYLEVLGQLSSASLGTHHSYSATEANISLLDFDRTHRVAFLNIAVGLTYNFS